MADVVSLKPKTADSDPEIVALFRMLLAEAQEGRITQAAVVFADDHGNLSSRYIYDSISEAIAAAAILQHELIDSLDDAYSSVN